MGYSDLAPVHYKLAFEPDLEQSAFSGTASIRARCIRPTGVIEMDCAELDIKSCRVCIRSPPQDSVNGVAGGGKGGAGGRGDSCTGNGDNKTEPLSVATDEKRERLVARMPRGTTIAHDLTIHLEFEGILNDRLLGFYRSSYTSGPDTKYMATTQFEAADARRAFPCWDRPDAKATFEISIAVSDRRHTAISNMPVDHITYGGATAVRGDGKGGRREGRGGQGKGKRTFHFGVTPPMSTYLVYMGVGEFSYATDRSDDAGSDGTVVRVITTKGVTRRVTRFALDCARQLLKLYESYFGIRYPLPKLDLLAIPDFAAGAMENWGAITFRDSLLLYDPRESSTRTKQLVAEVISHELAHQWFGNLVTMKWWNDLWLNESFATFMATKLLDELHPEWELPMQFLTDSMRPGMALDSLRSTHPINVPVRSPSQIREIFDSISYDKGGCVLRMLEAYVGRDSFRRGLADYLTRFKYGSAEGRDLWMCIERATSGRKPVSKVMGSWLNKPGFPMVSLELRTGNGDGDGDGDRGGGAATKERRGFELLVRQERFLLLAGGSYRSPSRLGRQSSPWPVPLLTRPSDSRSISTHLFSTESLAVAVPSFATRKRQSASTTPAPAHTIIANPGRSGFYRVRYDDAMMDRMMALAESGLLDASDLWALENDLFAMCVSGRARTGLYLKLLDAYKRVMDYTVLSDVGLNLSYLYLLSYGKPAEPVIRDYIGDLYRKVHGTAGWLPRKGEEHALSLLRGPAITWLGRIGDGTIIKECRRMYDMLLESSGAAIRGGVPPDLIEPACTVVAWNSPSGRDSLDIRDRLVAMYRESDTTEQRMRFLGAMCGFRYVMPLRRTLQFALSKDVRSQNLFLPVARVAENPHGRGVLWPWVRRNWTLISGKVGQGNPLLGRVVSSLAFTCERSDIPCIREFFAENPAPGTERTLRQTIERIRVAHAVRKRMGKEFKLAGYGDP